MIKTIKLFYWAFIYSVINFVNIGGSVMVFIGAFLWYKTMLWFTVSKPDRPLTKEQNTSFLFAEGYSSY